MRVRLGSLGAFAPSLVIALGVLVFLRLPALVGSEGLGPALIVLGAGHLLALATGLGLAAIGSDEKVATGGEAHVLSRSLGAAVGATVAWAQIVALSFIASLSAVVFAETVVPLGGLAPLSTTLRMAAIGCLVGLTVLALVRKSLAYGLAYLAIALGIAGVVSVVMGVWALPASPPRLLPPPAPSNLAAPFALIFPAAAGFLLTVSRADDLHNPRRALPRGILLAIFVAIVAQGGLALLLATRVPAETLSAPDALELLARMPRAVTVALVALAIGAAVASLVGAARIVQTIASDGLAPRGLAEGDSNEPRRALLPVLALAAAGVLIGDIDGLARVVTLVLLAAFALSNLAHAFVRLASPTFRPSFWLPSLVTLGAAVAAAYIMVRIDARAAFLALALVAILLLALAYRRFTRDADGFGDGIWAALVRSGLARLSRTPPRRFRPNVLMFRPPRDRLRPLREIASSLTRSGGMITELELSADPTAEPTTESTADPIELGVFQRRLRGDDLYRAISSISGHHGVPGLEPNTVLLDWLSLRADPMRLEATLGDLARFDLNILLYAPDPRAGDPKERRIDIWWKPAAGNVPLCLALVRLFERNRAFRGATIRFLLLSTKSASNEQLRSTMRVLLREAGVDATAEIIDQRLRAQSTEELIRSGSADAMLTIIGLPNDAPPYSESFHRRAEGLYGSLHALLMVHGSSAFEPVLQGSGRTTRSLLPPPTDGGVDLPPLELPADPRIAATVAKLGDGYEKLADRLFEDGIEQGYARDRELAERIKKAVELQFALLEKDLESAAPRRRKKAINRFHGSLLLECGRLLGQFSDDDLTRQQASVRASIATVLSDPALTPDPRRMLTVGRPGADEGDRASTGWFGLSVGRRIPVGMLEEFYFERAIEEMLLPAIRSFVTTSHQLIAQIGKTLSSITLALAVPDDEDEAALGARLAEHEKAFIDGLETLIADNREEMKRQQVELVASVRRIVQSFAADADRLDAERFVRRERRVRASEATARRGEIDRLQKGWAYGQRLVLDRARLGLQLASFQHRLLTAMAREKRAMVSSIRAGMLGECQRLEESLDALRTAIAAGKAKMPALEGNCDLGRRFDAEAVVERMTQSARQLAAELPHSVSTLTDDALESMLEGRAASILTVDVPVLRLAQFLVETKLIGPLQAALEEIPRLEQRAAGAAQDVIRLITHQLGEMEEEEASAAVAAQTVSVIDHSKKRLEEERGRLDTALTQALEVLDKQLTSVVAGTNAFELSKATADLEQLIRKHKGERAVSLARSMLDRGAASFEDVVTKLLYRRSEAVLMARQLAQGRGGRDRVVEHVIELVTRHTPREKVLDELPFYYRQLFLGQATINDAFWVSRDKELETARRALFAFEQGAGGAIVITGDRGSGKTALTMRVTSSDLGQRQTFRIFPPRAGSTEVEDLGAAIRQATGIDGGPERVLRELPEGSVLAFDDFEMWWARGEGGLAVIDEVLSLIERFGKRSLFILTLSKQSHAFINRLRPLADDALAVIECSPLPAADLRSIIMLRHASTGLRFQLGERAEDELGEWRQARLFSSLFDFSSGWVGPALRSWVSHVRAVRDNTLVIETPSRGNEDVLDDLRPEWVAILLQLIVHKQLDRARLSRITQESGVTIDHDLESLIRMGLVTETPQHVLDINPFVHHVVIDRFAHRGLVS